MRFILSSVLMIWSSCAMAQGLFSLDTRQEGRAWEAVGRLEIAGAAFCTGALIEPDLVLTAAHCLFDPGTGARVPIDEIQFLAGWRNGRAAAYRRVRKAVLHPEYRLDLQDGPSRVRNDIALIELQHPIRNTTITPFPTDEKPPQGARVGVVSYAHDRSQAPSLQEMCHVLSKQDGILVLTCSVDFGASGSPVFTFDLENKPHIVSVVSAKAEANGQKVSLATDLQAPLTVLRRELNRKGNPGVGLERMTAGQRRDTGAKIVRP